MPARKRAASPGAEEVVQEEEQKGPRRRSGRISSTPKQSVYFEDEEEDDDENEDNDFDDDGADDAGFDGGDDDDDGGDEGTRSTKRGRGRVGKQSKEAAGAGGKSKPKTKSKVKSPRGKVIRKPVAKKRKMKKEQEEEEEDADDYRDDEEDANDDEDEGGEEEDEDEDEDEGGGRRVTIIPLEKLRPLGGVEYADEMVHKNTLLFLSDLKANNKRPWLKSHDGEYRRAVKDWQSFVESITPKIIEVDFTVPELPAKDVVFRIHRDIRFSKDPTPYKPHFSAAWSRTGKKGPYACYYIHLEPGSCFIGGGLWCPEAGHLRKLRESIDEEPQRWRGVLNEERFKRNFLPKVPKKGGEEGALKAFADVNKGNALKKKPMGYNADHRDIELLKLRNFTISKRVDDGTFTEDDAQENICEIVAAMHPFITFLNSIVMPDINLDDGGDDDDGAENGGDDREVDGPPEDSGDDEEEEEEEG